jgi:hypothetical protein
LGFWKPEARRVSKRQSKRFEILVQVIFFELVRKFGLPVLPEMFRLVCGIEKAGMGSGQVAILHNAIIRQKGFGIEI